MTLKPAEPAPALAVDAASSWPGGPGGSGLSELKRRIWFTLGALVVYRVGTYVPIPGLDPAALEEVWWSLSPFVQYNTINYSGVPWPTSGGFFDIINIFSGGALERMTILALGVVPYVSALIIMHLLTPVWPALGRWKTEGAAGRRKFNQSIRYGALALAAVQSYGLAVGLEGLSGSYGPLVPDPGLFFRASTVITVVGGTMFLMWLGEQITARGMGNGIALIIFAGIVAGLPVALAGSFELYRTGAISNLFAIFLLILVIGTMALIVFMERAQRRITVRYSKGRAGNRMFGGDNSHLPLKPNTAGALPMIFASLLLPYPLAAMEFVGSGGREFLYTLISISSRGQPLQLIVYTALIVFFCFFCTTMMFNPREIANNLQNYGGLVAGIRPGKATADYLVYVQTRLTAIGATYLAGVFVLQEFLFSQFSALPFALVGTSLLIVVTVTVDTVADVYGRRKAERSD